jgi:hypothetical protein
MDQSQTREAELAEALLRYGRHEETCPDYDNDPPWQSCDCGWVEIMARFQKMGLI